MPVSSAPFTPHYVAASPTQVDLEYADLAIINLSKGDTPEGRRSLASQARDAMRTNGFFYVVGHGYEPEQTTRVFDIADIPFAHTSEEEKREYAGQMKLTGSYQGYKPRSYWHVNNGVRDQVENYNLNRDVTLRGHPRSLRPFLPEIREFARFNHEHVLHEVLRLLALGIELPEDTFSRLHGFDAVGETYVRFMKYYPRSQEDEKRSDGLWLKGHTDFGTITILWSQPVAALQILCPDKRWRWVKHIPNALVINAGDAMEFLTGGIYKGTIHRVVQPPEDQRSITRLGVFYFAMTDDDVRLTPSSLGASSPILANEGVLTVPEDEAPTMEQWRKGRTAAYGQSDLKKAETEGVETEVINGVVVKHYN